MKRILPLLLATSLFAAETETIHKNVIDFHPTALLSGLSGGYTRLMTEKLAFQLEVSTLLWDITGNDASGVAITYGTPIYTQKKATHRGMHSSFVMPFVRYQQSSTTVESPNGVYDYDTYEYLTQTTWSVKGVNIGLSGGRRWIFHSGFSLSFRAGYGFFPYFDSDRGDNPDIFTSSEWDQLELITKIIGGLDLMFTIGKAF